MTSVRVPGKVMLSGEYAVLHGGTAVLVPAARELVLREVDDGERVSVTPVLREALAEPIPEISEAEANLPPLQVELDRSAFLATTPDGRSAKLGLGGSAAEAVAAIALRLQRTGVDWQTSPRRVFDHADRAHRRAQGGVGSGADVAACAYRVPIRFRRDSGGVEIEPIVTRAPHGDLPMHLLYTGVSANTRQLVPPFQEWARRAASRDTLHRLRSLVDELAQAWFRSPPDDLFALLDEVDARMSTIMSDAGVPWRLPVHDELARWARDRGGRAKPTGAGGGDLVLLIGDLPVHERPELHLPLWPPVAS